MAYIRTRKINSNAFIEFNHDVRIIFACVSLLLASSILAGLNLFSAHLRVEDIPSSQRPYYRHLQGDGYVQVIFPNEVSAEVESAFIQAADYWDSVILTSNLEGITLSSDFVVQGSACPLIVPYTLPAGTFVDRLFVIAEIVALDGEFGTLGQASPCFYLENSNAVEIPVIGLMQFDIADIPSLQADGSFEEVIRHEMAHVLGIGTLWNGYFENPPLLTNPCTTFASNPCGNPVYSGINGIEGYRDLGGPISLLVANTGGGGTANGHWREAVFENELMTGFLNGGVINPASIMTLKALRDLDYVVDVNQAQSYAIPTSSISCQSRCSSGFDLSKACQCDSECADFGDCCPDYAPICLNEGTSSPTRGPIGPPSNFPTSSSPTHIPTPSPTPIPSSRPSEVPTAQPSSSAPTRNPIPLPTKSPTKAPSNSPSLSPSTSNPSRTPTLTPTIGPSSNPTKGPSHSPITPVPLEGPVVAPTPTPSQAPSNEPSISPSIIPTSSPVPNVLDPTNSCAGRCGSTRTMQGGCSCDSLCAASSTCCQDFEDVCYLTSSPTLPSEVPTSAPSNMIDMGDDIIPPDPDAERDLAKIDARNRRIAILASTLTVSTVLIIASSAFYLVWRRKKKKQQEAELAVKEEERIEALEV